MTKPLSVTSPTHAVALAVYFILGLLGAFYVLKLSSSSALATAMGPIADVWGTTLLVSGFGAFFSAIAAGRAKSPEANLRLEMLFTLGLFFAMGLFAYLAVVAFGTMAITSIVQALAFGLGALFRSVQIFFEVRLIRLAKAHPTSAPVMGDPRDEPDGG